MATDYSSMIPKEDLASFQKANPGLTFGAEDLAAYNNPNSYVYKPGSQNPKNGAISTSALSTPQTPINIAPVADQSAIYNAGTMAGTGTVQQGVELAQKQADELAAQNKYVEGSNALSTLQAQASGKAQDQASAYAQSGGVNDLFKQLSQLNVEAQGLQRQTLANPLQQQESAIGTGRVQGQVDQITAQNQRSIALKALDLGQRAAIAQGNYDVAKNLADQQIEAKYAGLTAQIEAQKTNLAALDKIVLTPAQEKRKEAQAQLLKKQEQEIADKKAADKAVNDMLIEASPVAPPDVLAKAKDIQAKGGTAVQVAAALGKYGGDYLKNELLKEQIKTAQSSRALAQQKADGTNIAGKPLKVSNTEITNLNEALTARDSVNSLVNQFKQNIKDYGTQTVFGKGSGDREALRTNLLLAIKNMEKTGALDAGTINVLEGTIPSSKFFATEEAQQASLDTLLSTVNSKVDSYTNSYKGTSAELDPRTKRAYEVAPIVSTGNKAADDYFKMTSAALNQVNTSLSTPNAVTAGYSDNQK